MARPCSSSGGLVVLFLSLCSIFLIVDSTDTKKPLIDAKLLNSKIQVKQTYKVGPEEQYKSVQAAIDAVPEGNSQWVVVHVKAGTYREQVVVPENKPYIYLRGNGKGKTTIVWDECSIDNTKSATFNLEASNFIAFGVTFKNNAERDLPNLARNQSVAAKVSGDKVAFYHCGFYSPHNTLFDHRGRHYYESCYIQGNIDFIFGRGQSLFQSCEIFVLPDGRNDILGSITAQNRKSEKCTSGFVFLKGKVYGVGEVYLGRANEPFSRVIFANTYFSKTISPVGWTNWSYSGDTKGLMIGEHDCHGPGGDPKHRAEWARQFSKEEVEPFLGVDFINGSEWLPVYY
ncbi:putative pectinesterase 67 [Carex littledalei]|uniref:Pectinesterase n=1 Tax=Carex littledalei TaxID=544730 RepID=A0A833VI97_9POAL|nr:putative pectinesterase 67 [Carex littledalei]